MIIAGRVSQKMAPVIKQLHAQMPKPTPGPPRSDNGILSSLPLADAEVHRADQSRLAWEVVIGDAHLPAYLLDGVIYIQAPLQEVRG